MKKVMSGVAIVALLCFVTSLSRAQDSAKGEKTFKTKCAGCHGADAAGKAAVKSPSLKHQLKFLIELAFADNVSSWSLQGDGGWTRRTPGGKEPALDFQKQLMLGPAGVEAL